MALGYGLMLAATAGAQLTVQSAARRLTMVGGAGLGFVNDLVACENRRLRILAQAVAERVAGDAARAGVTCTTEAPALAYPNLVARLTARARLADLTVWMPRRGRWISIATDRRGSIRERSSARRRADGPLGVLRAAGRRCLGWEAHRLPGPQTTRCRSCARRGGRDRIGGRREGLVGLGRRRGIRAAPRASWRERFGGTSCLSSPTCGDAQGSSWTVPRGHAGDGSLPTLAPAGMVPRRRDAGRS